MSKITAIKKQCNTCRWWSEQEFKMVEGFHAAMCLSLDSLHWCDYVFGVASCKAWESGHFGAADQPSGNPYEHEGD